MHKHLDHDPLIQFREAFGWVDQSAARLVADAGCGYGGFAVFVARQAPTLAVDGYTLSDVQQAVAQQVLARLQLSRSRVLLQSYDRLQRQYDAIVAIESPGHSSDVAATLRHWARQLRPGGVIVIIDELFGPEVSLANPEIQQFMRSLHFSVLLQRTPIEAMLHRARRAPCWSRQRYPFGRRKCRRLRRGPGALGFLTGRTAGGQVGDAGNARVGVRGADDRRDAVVRSGCTRLADYRRARISAAAWSVILPILSDVPKGGNAAITADNWVMGRLLLSPSLKKRLQKWVVPARVQGRSRQISSRLLKTSLCCCGTL